MTIDISKLSPLELSIVEMEKEEKKLTGDENNAGDEVDQIVDDAKKEAEEEHEVEPEDDEQEGEATTQEEGDEPDEEDEPKTNNAWAKKRIELKEAQKRADELEKQLAYLRGKADANPQTNQAAPAKPEVVQPKKYDPVYETEEWAKSQEDKSNKLEEQNSQLQNQLLAMQLNILTRDAEAEAMRNNAEYSDTKKVLEDRKYELKKIEYYNTLKATYPSVPRENIVQYMQQNDHLIRNDARNEVQRMVTNAAVAQEDVAKTILNSAKLLGYTSKSTVEEKSAKSEERSTKPGLNIDKLKQNKQRASSFSGSGSGRGNPGKPTAEEIADATLLDLIPIVESARFTV